MPLVRSVLSEEDHKPRVPARKDRRTGILSARQNEPRKLDGAHAAAGGNGQLELRIRLGDCWDEEG